MNWIAQLAQFDSSKVLLFALVLSRVSGLVMTAPIYGTAETPLQVRTLLAFALAVLVMPSQWAVAVPEPGCLLNGLVFVGSELLIGVALGLGVTILFSGAQLAGQLVGHMGGLQLADVFDPTFDTTISLFSRFLFLVAVAVFVTIGGHRVVMAALLDTFTTIPPASGALPSSFAYTYCNLVGQSFMLAFRAAAPVTVALLLATLVLGLISRTLPQLNVLALGFGLNAFLTMGTLALTLGAATLLFQEHLDPALDAVLEGLRIAPDVPAWSSTP